jgi:alcohol dehydrogenase class IV
VIQNFAFPNLVLFGAGALQSLPDELKKLDCDRPLLVTDKGVVACGLATRVEETVREAGLEPIVFDGVDANPTEGNAEQGLLAYSGNACDGIIGLGGGSPLDTAKAIKLKVDHSLPLADYAIEHHGWEKMVNPMPPMIAITTTAGTGSDVSRGALIIVRPAGAKVAIVGPPLYPDVTIADPELTLGLPPHRLEPLRLAGIDQDREHHPVVRIDHDLGEPSRAGQGGAGGIDRDAGERLQHVVAGDRQDVLQRGKQVCQCM